MDYVQNADKILGGIFTMRRKLFCAIAFAFLALFTLASCGDSKDSEIISTSFAGYDFARAVAGDSMSADMLLEPGEELHDYSPSVGDVESILDSKVFIYIGGESDEEWVEEQILPSIDTTKTVVVNMMEVVEHKGTLYEEENPASAEESEHHHHDDEENLTATHTHEEGEEEEYDEHVWTSITNAKYIINAIYEALAKIDSDNADTYKANMNTYTASLDTCDTAIKNVVASASKSILVFADRFPLLYFVREYGLSYDAAFKGCESSKEASATTIESLTSVVKENNLGIIFVIELSEANIADTIISNCAADGYTVTKETFYTMHNVSKDDYKAGTTYVDFMNHNIEVLEAALN